jgi:hypothetical protein
MNKKRKSLLSKTCINALPTPLHVRHRWSGYMVFDGRREWQLPVSCDRAAQIVERQVPELSCQIRRKVVRALTANEWIDRADRRA